METRLGQALGTAGAGTDYSDVTDALMGLGIGLNGDLLTAVVMEAAMPCMLLGIVICERYGLDTLLCAEAVTVSTGLSAFNLPAWYHWLT